MIRRRAKAATRGFSLLEMMISLAVIAIALFAVFSFILHTFNAKEAMRELEVAKQATTSKMEEIKAQIWDNISTFATTQTPAQLTVNDLVSATNPTQRAQMVLTVQPVMDPGSPLKPIIWDVTIRLDWKGVNGTRTYRVNNLISQF